MAKRNLSKYERAWHARRGAMPDGFVAGGHFDVAGEVGAADEVAFTMTPGDKVEFAAAARSADGDSVEGQGEEAAAVAPVETASTPVASSPPLVATFTGSGNVVRAELDTATGIVTVTFKSGGPYRYGNFTPELLEEWRAAPSAGRWFHINVRSKPAQHPLIPAPRAAE